MLKQDMQTSERFTVPTSIFFNAMYVFDKAIFFIFDLHQSTFQKFFYMLFLIIHSIHTN